MALTTLLQYLSNRHPAAGIHHNPSRSLQIAVVASLVFFSTRFMCDFTIISNDDFLEKILEKIEANADTPAKRQAGISARESLETALRVPGVKTLLAAKGAIFSGITLFMFLLMYGLISAIIVGHIGYFRAFIRIALSLTIILSVGFIVNTLLKFVFVDHLFVFGPSLVTGFGNDAGDGLSLLCQFDGFTLLYIAVLSWGLSLVGRESFVTFCLIALGCWAILLLSSFSLGIPFGFAE